jgi:hypothetical protein
MTERPILFSGPMIRAILDGRKKMTRRVMKPQPSEGFCHAVVGKYHPIIVRKDGEEEPGPEVYGVYDEGEDYPCPYGAPGDTLWCKETWRESDDGFIYRADHDHPAEGIWRPSIFMPRKASRITLELTNVRVHRLQVITWQDVLAEGIGSGSVVGPNPDNPVWVENVIDSFKNLWNSINGDRDGGIYAWEKSPFVWALSFKVVKP